LLLELCEAYIWAAISEAGISNELILCSRGNLLCTPLSCHNTMIGSNALEGKKF
jgi:hypothetical protein